MALDADRGQFAQGGAQRARLPRQAWLYPERTRTQHGRYDASIFNAEDNAYEF